MPLFSGEQKMEYSEGKLNPPNPRVDRYARRIEHCTSKEELRELLTLIISARLPEPEFSRLYAATTRRCAKLKELAKEP